MEEEIVLTEEDLQEVLSCDDDAELLEQWFEAGERMAEDKPDWIYWVDLYEDRPNRSDLIVHWLRCLFDPTLPRPRELAEAA
jgi:hypothetical protein